MNGIAEVVLGIDLGTRFTKVGVRGTLPGLANGAVIRFGRFAESGGLLLPSHFYGADVGAGFTPPLPGAEWHRSIKSGLADCVTAREEDRSWTMGSKKWRNGVGFLALVLRYSLRQVLPLAKDDPDGRWLRFRVVIGVPNSIPRTPEVARAYDDVLRRAWRLATTRGPIVVPLDGMEHTPREPGLIVETRSEMEALVDGWLSAQGDVTGPHVLIDIGALYTQLIAFNVADASTRGYVATACHHIPVGTNLRDDSGNLARLRYELDAWLPTAVGSARPVPVLLAGGGARESALARVVAEVAPNARVLGKAGTATHCLRLVHGLTLPSLRRVLPSRAGATGTPTRPSAHPRPLFERSPVAPVSSSDKEEVSEARARLVGLLSSRIENHPDLLAPWPDKRPPTPRTGNMGRVASRILLRPTAKPAARRPERIAEARASRWAGPADELLATLRRGPTRPTALRPDGGRAAARPVERDRETNSTTAVPEAKRRPPYDRGSTNHGIVPDVLRRHEAPPRARSRLESRVQTPRVRLGDTQYDSATETSRTTDVIIGLDFGTSSTKMVIQTPTLGGQRAVPVLLGDGPEQGWGRYLLPTRIRVRGDGLIEVGALTGDDVHGDLKVALIDICTAADGKVDAAYRRHRMALAAGYLGTVLRDARHRYLQAEVDALSHRSLRWQLNLGIPSAGYGDGVMRNVFSAIGRAAWQLSTTRDPITLDAVEAALDAAPPSGVEIDIVPEVAAQVVGYAQSPSRRNGLHLLVDIGASTLDVCAFNLHERDYEDHYALLMADVQRLGTYELHRRRLEALGRGTEWRPELAQLAPDRELRPPATNGRGGSRLVAADDGYVSAARKVVMQVLMDIRRERYPNAPNWDRGLPVFLGGGGSLDLAATKLMEVCSKALTRATRARPLVIRKFPVPTNFDASALTEGRRQSGVQIVNLFHRSSVAFGLSYDALNIGQITPPNEVDPIRPIPARSFEHLYVGKDQV